MELLNKSKTNFKERPIKVLQFGEGGFLRAFVDYMIDIANEKGEFDGNIVIVKPIEFGNLDFFHQQDCQYTLELRGKENGEAKKVRRQITSVADAIGAVEDYDKFNIIGRTRDDAAGEAFDKVARSIGLGYPGGPKIDKAAKLGNPDAITFPKAKMSDNPYDFSFSGLKSAVLNYLNHAKMTGEEVNPNDLAASFQKAVVQVLVEHAILGTKEHGFRKLALAGGVASNSALRASLKEACEKNGITLYYPSPIFCTDNAAMIGAAGYYEYKKGRRSGWDLNAAASLKLGER